MRRDLATLDTPEVGKVGAFRTDGGAIGQFYCYDVAHLDFRRVWPSLGDKRSRHLTVFAKHIALFGAASRELGCDDSVSLAAPDATSPIIVRTGAPNLLGVVMPSKLDDPTQQSWFKVEG